MVQELNFCLGLMINFDNINDIKISIYIRKHYIYFILIFFNINYIFKKFDYLKIYYISNINDYSCKMFHLQ